MKEILAKAVTNGKIAESVDTLQEIDAAKANNQKALNIWEAWVYSLSIPFKTRSSTSIKFHYITSMNPNQLIYVLHYNMYSQKSSINSNSIFAEHIVLYIV